MWQCPIRLWREVEFEIHGLENQILGSALYPSEEKMSCGLLPAFCLLLWLVLKDLVTKSKFGGGFIKIIKLNT